MKIQIFQKYSKNKLFTYKENCLLYVGVKRAILTGTRSYSCGHFP